MLLSLVAEPVVVVVVTGAVLPAEGSVPAVGGGGGAIVFPVFFGAVSTINGGLPEPTASA